MEPRSHILPNYYFVQLLTAEGEIRGREKKAETSIMKFYNIFPASESIKYCFITQQTSNGYIATYYNIWILYPNKSRGSWADGPTSRLYIVNWSLCPIEQWGLWAIPVLKGCQSLHHFESADVLLFRVAFKHLPAQHPASD